MKNEKGGGFIILIVSLIAILLLVVGIVIFFSISSNKTNLKNEEGVNCGVVPSSLGEVKKDEFNDYFKNNNEVKENLECISQNIKDCKSSSIFYNVRKSNFTLTIDGMENNFCIIRYDRPNPPPPYNEMETIGIKCKYPKDFLNSIFILNEENNALWSLSTQIGSLMGVRLMIDYEKGKETTIELPEGPYSEDKVEIPCEFY